MSSELKCHSCNHELKLETTKVMRSDECPKCYASIRCCKMCTFFDPTAYNECRETSADRILEKDKSNFCDYFELKSSSNPDESKNKIIDAANALFKD